MKEKRNQKNEKNLKEKGITLVALVVTIIILLILVGVTIGIITGDNGLFNKVKEATEKYKDSSAKENNDIKKLEEYLEKIEEQKDKNGIYIYTEAELKEFRDNVNSGINYEGKNVYLMRDINLHGDKSNQETWWEPIGKGDNKFKGNFEGNNKQITNLYGSYDGSNGTSVGFFGKIEEASIKNLTVSGEINTNGTVTEVGGILGEVDGKLKIEGCNNNVNIIAESDNVFTGGIIGNTKNNSQVNIQNCTNRGNLKGKGRTAGCIGKIDNNSGEINIDNFTNYGNITSSSAESSGCIGFINRAGVVVKIENTKNLCNEVKGYLTVGGIIGYGRENAKIIINSCYNTSNIISETRESGGIIGDIDSITYCINVYNEGECIANKNTDRVDFSSAGGIIGSSYINSAEIKIINAYNTGKITSYNFACGIIGYRSNLINNSYIKNVYNKGVLESEKGTKYGILAKKPTIAEIKFNEVKNAFYINEEKGSNLETDVGIKKTDTDLKSQEFINELNKYVTENPILQIEGIEQIELLKWKTGETGYPVLDIQ